MIDTLHDLQQMADARPWVQRVRITLANWLVRSLGLRVYTHQSVTEAGRRLRDVCVLVQKSGALPRWPRVSGKLDRWTAEAMGDLLLAELCLHQAKSPEQRDALPVVHRPVAYIDAVMSLNRRLERASG
jgi:hypothetical protein